MDNNGSAARHSWLELARDFCADHLRDTAALAVPRNTRISIGFAYASRKAIGQCWNEGNSADTHHEVLISPVLADGVEIMATVLHELIHAALPANVKHGAPFKRAAIAAGLAGKMTATVCGDALRVTFKQWLDVNPYPAGALNVNSATRKKQSTRLLKVECGDCGYVARVSAKWLNESGAPHCPNHGPMTAQGGDSETETEE